MNMNKTYQFLSDCKTFFLASTEGEQPRVRPFGAVALFDGKLYICTNKTKKVFQQMLINPNIEISACSTNGKWIRISCVAVPDSRLESKSAMLEANPGLKRMYAPDDNIFEVLYLKDATVTIESFTGGADTFKF